MAIIKAAHTEKSQVLNSGLKHSGVISITVILVGLLANSCTPAAKSSASCYHRAEEVYNAATGQIRSNPTAASRSVEISANMVLTCPPADRAERANLNPPGLVAGSRLVLAAQIAHEAGEPVRAKLLLIRALRTLRSVQVGDLQSGMTGVLYEEITEAKNALAGKWKTYY